MHGGHSLEDEPMAEMNLIPMIDVALTLLIILMVTTAFIKHPGVTLKLPETVTREGAPETNKDLTIVVASDNKIYLDGKATEDPVVQEHLKTVAAKDKESRILIKGDRTVPYARIMDVMDMARQAGLTHITLPTDPKKAEAPAQ
ncbi:MAG TPA: biopolymer transporter ExbD [Chthonomonadaceae bacterium]|nr:biopolymer transporter ExbD [Chthonomonadaceae bacterium]